VPEVPNAVREWLASDPEATTYQFVLRALVSDPASQLMTMRKELEELRPHRDAASQLGAAREELAQLRPLREELASLSAEVEAVRRAHEVQGQRLVNERVAFADGLAHVQAAVYGSRSWRLTRPLRAVTAMLRRGG